MPAPSYLKNAIILKKVKVSPKVVYAGMSWEESPKVMSMSRKVNKGMLSSHAYICSQ